MDKLTLKRYLPWLIASALFMEQLDTTIVNTAVPTIAASLNVAPLSLKAIVASYILSFAVCIPMSGWLADHFGTKRVFSMAVILFTLSSILCGLSVNAPMLVAARILQGIAAAMMMPVGLFSYSAYLFKTRAIKSDELCHYSGIDRTLIRPNHRWRHCALALLA